MRIERFAAIVALTTLLASGCATARSPHRSSDQHGALESSSASDNYQADPPMRTMPQLDAQGPLLPIPVPPAIGVSHVKQVGYFSAISFSRYLGYKSECAKESTRVSPTNEPCATEPDCGCFQNSGYRSSFNIFGGFCPKKSACTSEPTCGSIGVPCHQNPGRCAPEFGCVPHVNCVPMYGQPLADSDCCTDSGCNSDGCSSNKSCLLPSMKFPTFKMPTCKLPSIRMPRVQMPHLNFPKMKIPTMPCCWKSRLAKKCSKSECGDACVDEGCGSHSGAEPIRKNELCRPSHGLSPLAAPMQDPFAGQGSEDQGHQPAQQQPSSTQAVPEVPEQAPAPPIQQIPGAPAPPTASVEIHQPEVGTPQATQDIPAAAQPVDVTNPVPVAPASAAEVVPDQTYVEPIIWPRLKGASDPVIRGSAKVNAWSTSWRVQ